MLKNLALVAPGEGTGLADSLNRLPPGSSAMVVVSAEDRQGLRVLEMKASTLHQLLVVLLEDFGELAASQPRVHLAEFPNVGLTRCRPGELLETLQSLAALGDKPKPRADATVGARAA